MKSLNCHHNIMQRPAISWCHRRFTFLSCVQLQTAEKSWYFFKLVIYLQKHGAADGSCKGPVIHLVQIFIPVEVTGQKSKSVNFLREKEYLAHFNQTDRDEACHNIFSNLIIAHSSFYFLLFQGWNKKKCFTNRMLLIHISTVWGCAP